MAKKKKGLSRRTLQKLTRLTRSSWISKEPLVGRINFEKTTGRFTLSVKTEAGGLVVKAEEGAKPLRRLRVEKLRVVAPEKKANTIASRLITVSTHEVIAALGITPLRIAAKPEAIITPEVVHSVGRLVATHAICMAGGYEASGGIIGSIGRSGVDVEIGPAGEVSTRVCTKPVRKRGKSSKVSAPRTETPTEVPAKKKGGKKPVVEVGNTSILKNKDGITIIHIHFDIHIDADVVHQVNVDSEGAKQFVIDDITALKDEIEKKLLAAQNNQSN